MDDFDLEPITWDTIFPEKRTSITSELIEKSADHNSKCVYWFAKLFKCCW